MAAGTARRWRPSDTLLVTLVLIAVAFAIGWLLPRRPREPAAH